MGRPTHPSQRPALSRADVWSLRGLNGSSLAARCGPRWPRIATVLLTLGGTLQPLSPICAAEGPILWGYGVKSCQEFLRATPGAGGAAAGEAELARYREWLAGLVTGLDLATGLDVLKGAELEAALTRIRSHCEANPQDDFFNASLALLKSLGTTEAAGKK